MQAITRKKTGVSLYIFSDDKVIRIGDEVTVIGDPVELIISDCSTATAALYADVTPPSDWAGGKYTFISGEWVMVHGWVDPPLKPGRGR